MGWRTRLQTHKGVPRGPHGPKKVFQYLPFRLQKLFWPCGQIPSAKKCSKLLKSFGTVKIYSWHFESAHPLLIRNLDFQRLSARFHWADGSKMWALLYLSCSLTGKSKWHLPRWSFSPRTVTYVCKYKCFEKLSRSNLRPLDPSFVNTFCKVPCWRQPKTGEHSPPCSDWKPW